MASFRPQYCETPDEITGVFPVEPANAISSGVIVLFGLAALVLVTRRAPRAFELYVLCALLIVNGVGSILWHGLRERWALTLDVTPALIFLLGVSVVWARRVAPWRHVGVAAIAIVAFWLVMRNVDLGMRLPGRWGAMAPMIVVLALWLIARSYAISKTAALTGGLALVSALAALTFRSIDRFACEWSPVGSHFLWHILLSAAAFLCIRTIVTLSEKQAGGEEPKPAESVA